MITNKNSQPEEIDELEIIESIEKINQVEFKMNSFERKLDEFEKVINGFSSSTNNAVNIFKQSDSLTNNELLKIKNITDELEENMQKLDSDYSNLKYFAIFSGIIGTMFMIISVVLIFHIINNS
jgi:hypothetical protein|nr:MAG TPA: hypothetical protein [Caudoviricetes sp.]DAR86185.1 MAG TPA: hypothetical protein [Caudoviricetes sp.]DAS32649.1 MAG TPA: hypothetical protein [Caudoviricetes sp.]